jgi:multisubunit Na+/H+ antiporter MnhB subunit
MLIFTLIVAVVAIELRDLLSSIMALGAVGFGLSIIFLLLQAPEVMTAQIVVEILCFVLMIATIFKTSRQDTTKRFALHDFSASYIIFFAAIFIIVFIRGIHDLPAFGKPVMKVSGEYIGMVLDKIGATNIVTAILLDFRTFNTLAEVLVLITMAVGVVAIMRRKGRLLVTDEEEVEAENES